MPRIEGGPAPRVSKNSFTRAHGPAKVITIGFAAARVGKKLEQRLGANRRKDAARRQYTWLRRAFDHDRATVFVEEEPFGAGAITAFDHDSDLALARVVEGQGREARPRQESVRPLEAPSA